METRIESMVDSEKVGEWFSNGWFESLEKNCDIKASMKMVMHILVLCVGKRENHLNIGLGLLP